LQIRCTAADQPTVEHVVHIADVVALDCCVRDQVNQLDLGGIEGVERNDGSRVPLIGLSRGTSEQLYLALRFGLVEHFVDTSKEPLPIVMDDILVNFDADRAERAARSIEELSKTCQVIYFTCHPTTPLRPDLEKTLRPMT
jgi:hypothetical protein